MRWVFCIGTTLLLAGCAAQRWPVAGDGRWASDFPVIKQRYDAATTKCLGTPQDVANIKRRVWQEPLHVRQIRWVSPTEVMVDAWNTGLGYVEYYCVLEKKDGKWRMTESYVGAVS